MNLPKPLKAKLALSAYPLVRLGVRNLSSVESRKGLIRWMQRYIGWRHFETTFSSRDGIRFMADLSDAIPQHIYLHGEWEACLSRFVRERLTEGQTFIDVGANIGYFTLLAAKLVGRSGRVVCVEASPAIYKRLNTNIELNGFTNVRAVHMAASDKARELDLYEPTEDTGSTTTSLARSRERESTFVGSVHAEPLSEILEPDEISSARLIKIDVEGAEWDVCAGLLPVLEKAPHNVEIVVEVTPYALESEGRTAAQLIAKFAALGFFPYVIENSYDINDILAGPKNWRPTRLRSELTAQTDIAFSRIDAEVL